DTYRCGVCDIFLERNKLELSDMEFSTVSNQIKDFLHENPLTLTDLANKIQGVREDKTIKVLQWLIDNSKIKTNSENLLEWRK
ncbi:MAG: hypothetical protein OQK43_07720, partial [Flavobacteriales bacterium]|nr:hypothetical protein [Flavobacteriales bacterium]